VQHDARALQRRDSDEARHHAGGTVEIAAMWHGVEMRADDHAFRRRVAAGQRHVEIRRCVMRDAEAKPVRDRGHRRMRALFARAIGIARYAGFIQAVATQPVEQ
jgi:hypothetical protein